MAWWSSGGRSRWEAVLEKVTRSQWRGAPAGTGPGVERSLVVANISHVSNLVWVFRGVVLVFWAFSYEKTL